MWGWCLAMFDSAAVDRHCPAQFGAQVGDQCAIQFHSLHPHMESCKAGRVFQGASNGGSWVHFLNFVVRLG